MPEPGWPDRLDPGYQRHCLRPDCTAAFNMLDVMNGDASAAGWRDFTRVILGYACPAHAGPVVDGGHLPAWTRDGDAGPATGIRCGCGWHWEPPALPVMLAVYQAAWVAHLIALDPPGMVGRSYLLHGQPVTVIARWAKPSPASGGVTWHRPPKPGAPRNVLLELADGSRTIRPFRGLRRITRKDDDGRR